MRAKGAASGILFIGILATACGPGLGGSGPLSGSADAVSLPPLGGDNVLPVTVNGSLCSPETSADYPNKPCVSVTVCAPGTSRCQTVSDILLDTGSYGLRIFKSVLNNINLPVVTTAAGTIAECAQFGDGSSDWGPIETADVILGNEPAARVPIQVIDAGFTGASAKCGGSDQSPSAAGFNGILGVGLFAQDCGTSCTGDSGNGMYFACNGSSCSGAAPSLAGQVTNPVSVLPQDNNGVIVRLPAAPPGGASWANGYLVLGIGTRADNVPSGVSAYPADPISGEFSTAFDGKTYPSFIDSGSNGLFFQAPSSVPDCGSQDPSFPGWLCPASVTGFSATNISQTGTPKGTVSFSIGNAIDLVKDGSSVFAELGGADSAEFDWGLPFFLGRDVYVGLERTVSSVGTGPYWAYH